MPAQPNKSAQKLPNPSNLHPDTHDPDPVPFPRGKHESKHNKHNDPAKGHHKPQKHTTGEEKR
jgi:hypothetical protein